jgi:hypothetical protein
MKTRLLHECDSFGRSLVFWKTNLADIPPGSAGAGYYAKLGADNTALVQGGALQKPISVSAQNALILKLDSELEVLATVAGAYAQDVPGFDDLFPRPAHLNPGEVLRTANVFLTNLVPTPEDDAATVAAKAARVQVFVDHGAAATFVADLQGQLKAIGTVTETHEQSREQGVLSTAQIAELVRDGKKQRNYLNAIAVTLYKNQPEKLAAWNTASHVERGPNHSAVKPTPAPAPAPTATATK